MSVAWLGSSVGPLLYSLYVVTYSTCIVFMKEVAWLWLWWSYNFKWVILLVIFNRFQPFPRDDCVGNFQAFMIAWVYYTCTVCSWVFSVGIGWYFGRRLLSYGAS